MPTIVTTPSEILNTLDDKFFLARFPNANNIDPISKRLSFERNWNINNNY